MSTTFNGHSTWADEQRGSLERSRNRYQSAFLIGLGLNALAMIAVCTLAHYQTLIPLMVHHYDNGVTTVERIEQPVLNRAQIESDIARYVLYREAFDESSYRAQVGLISLLSNDATQKDYLREQSSPDSLVKKGESIKREVHLYSINFIDAHLDNEQDIHKDHHNLAEVVFNLTDTDKQTGKTTQSTYNALISWRYTTPSSSPAIRWQNWDGFEVVRYSKQPRAGHES